MDVLLYQLSTLAQLVSVLIIALFYATLARAVPRAEVTWWSRSWWYDLAALAVTVSYWFFTPSDVVARVILALYVTGKIAFVLMLVQGAMSFRVPGALWISKRTLTLILAGMALFGTVFLGSIDRVGVGVQGIMGALFLWCGIRLLRDRSEATTWLAAGFIARGWFALVEALAYGAHMLPKSMLTDAQSANFTLFLGMHSSIDVAAEWLLALGGVLALTRRAQTHLESANDHLLVVQEELRRLADRDPLTGLANRRALPEAFRSAYDTGASLVFCDLNQFKRINDTYGHAAGDASLVRFATALRASFRPDDDVIRFAGDEFLVVCKTMELGMAMDRVERVRSRLADPGDHVIPLEFSAGVVYLEPGGDADAALRAADAAMYETKRMVLREP
ncbi:MAG: GGDEF domain-containing protein [bacterium]